jgi:hydrogenase maturation protease
MIAVVGCGSPNRSDDGVGSEVLRALRSALPAAPEVQLLDAGTDGLAVMFAARGCSTLVVIDASQSGAPPGSVFEVPGDQLAPAQPPALGLHDFRWDHALHAGRQLFKERFPQDVVVLLVEGRSFELGVGLSAEVAAAVPAVCARVAALVAARLHGAGRRAECPLLLKRGSLHLARAGYERYFSRAEAVALARDGDDLLVLPLLGAHTGGYLLKQINLAGDRAAHVGGFLREQGLSDELLVQRSAPWNEARGALVLEAFFSQLQT